MNEQIEAKIQIAGTFEWRDKDGNLIKAVPFTGAVPVEQEEQREDDGNVRE